MNNQKTYHKQTAKFLSSVATCIPELSSDVMKGWIDNPKILQKVLKQALCLAGCCPASVLGTDGTREALW